MLFSSRTGGNGLPLAKLTFPFDHLNASAKVHSALSVGLERGKMMGFWLILDISWITFLSNAPGRTADPMRAVGLISLIALRSELGGLLGSLNSMSWAKATLWAWRPPLSLRALVTTPFESNRIHRFLASSKGMPYQRVKAIATKDAIPVAASPAPKKRNFWSSRSPWFFLNAANIPARPMVAVPWMSSLKHGVFSRYLSSNVKALWFAKSSNCTKQWGCHSFTAVINSSMNSIYSWPVILGFLTPGYFGSSSRSLLFVPISIITGRHVAGDTPPMAL
mmetsp:Transcript_20667/g.39893  ORF Transcript_20667/g.39893 Transcript_20667/m.39893 type:complete len:278 (+) Transcript_20667:524-1357(+)